MCVSVYRCCVYVIGLDHEARDIELVMRNRIRQQQRLANITVLIHEHIPKVGGTALSLALTSECICRAHTHIQYMCSRCPEVRSSSGFRFKYSVSRTSGWIFGIHPPLAKFIALINAPKKRTQLQVNGLVPVYIIMLREPFARFISEAVNWVGSQQVGPDWGIWFETQRAPSMPNLDFEANEKPLLDYVTTYANLNMSFIFHNRQTKYIGGKIGDFRAHFNSRKEMGSIWLPHDSVESIHKVMETAEQIITYYPSVILGIHERFEETLCVLEIVYGHLWNFRWRRSRHAHNNKERTNNYNLTKEKEQVNMYRTKHASTVYEPWKERNGADIELYNRAVAVFDIQFKQALVLFKEIVDLEQSVRAPHCMRFV
jgi:hypothetical protein